MELWQIWFCAENRRILRHILKQFESAKNLYKSDGLYVPIVKNHITNSSMIFNARTPWNTSKLKILIKDRLASSQRSTTFFTSVPFSSKRMMSMSGASWGMVPSTNVTVDKITTARDKKAYTLAKELTFSFKSFHFLLSNYLGCQGCFRVFCQVPEIFPQEPILAVTEILFLQTFLIFLLAQILRFNFLVDFRFIRWKWFSKICQQRDRIYCDLFVYSKTLFIRNGIFLKCELNTCCTFVIPG